MSKFPLAESNLKVLSAARLAGLEIDIRISPEPTRTAEEAAAVCGCDVAQIVKSLIFQGKQSNQAFLFLVSGRNRVHESAVGKRIGDKLVRPDAAFVREVTGFAIGGIPPFGHKTALKTFIDQDLLTFESVFAAAGTPNSIFEVGSKALAAAVNAEVISVV